MNDVDDDFGAKMMMCALPPPRASRLSAQFCVFVSQARLHALIKKHKKSSLARSILKVHSTLHRGQRGIKSIVLGFSLLYKLEMKNL